MVRSTANCTAPALLTAGEGWKWCVAAVVVGRWRQRLRYPLHASPLAPLAAGPLQARTAVLVAVSSAMRRLPGPNQRRGRLPPACCRSAWSASGAPTSRPS